MCNCVCADEVKNDFRKIGNKIIIIENHPDCKFCGEEGIIVISVLNDDGVKIFKQMGYDLEDSKELGDWNDYTNSIDIKKSNFRNLN